MASGALIGVGAFLVWHHHEQDAVDARRAEFTAAANTGVVNLLSMDFTKGDADLQRLIDSTTGEFRYDFENSRGAFLNVLRSSKATTTATIKASAVAEMGRDSALVLVAAGSEVSNTAAAKQPPRAWRLAVTVRRDSAKHGSTCIIRSVQIDTVEVVTRFLGRNCEAGFLEQRFALRRRDGEAVCQIAFGHYGEVVHWQGSEREFRLARFNR